MSLTYAQTLTTLANLATYDETDPDFLQILPSIISDAEGRIYRELDLLSTVVRDTSATCTANSRNFTLPSAMGRFVTLDGINVITPTGTTTATGTRNPLGTVSRDYLDMVWPAEAAVAVTTVPANFAMITDQTIIFGPPPGAPFTVEVIGMIDPTPLSSSNTTTYLSLYLPDLFLAACMVFLTGYQKNFGSQSDNPQASVSWESHYQTLFASANLQDARQKFASSGWTSKQPEPLAAQPR